MKKLIHLYILLALSGISSFFKIQSAFFSHFDQSVFEGIQMEGKEEFIQVMQATVGLQSSLVNKLAVVLFFILLGMTLVFCIKKRLDVASYAYIGYLFATLLTNTYNYMGTRQIAQLYTVSDLRQATEQVAWGGYVLGIALFVVFSGVTLFFLFRKPKETATVSSGMDI